MKVKLDNVCENIFKIINCFKMMGNRKRCQRCFYFNFLFSQVVKLMLDSWVLRYPWKEEAEQI